MFTQKILDNLFCLECQGVLAAREEFLICQGCGQRCIIDKGVPFLIKRKGETVNQQGSDAIINKLKVVFKRFPWFFNILLYAFGPSFVGKSAKKAIKDLGDDKIILNIGSGIRVIRKDVVNVDFYPFVNVNIVADATQLPFKDNSVDAIVCESLLEHTPEPELVVAEARRVLRPGGLIYLSIPFLAPFHSSPNDYLRLSQEGIRVLTRGFQEEESGIRQGPTSALVLTAVDWLATVLSLGFPPLQQILVMLFTIATFPIKFLDVFICRLKTAGNIAYGFYYIGSKREPKLID